MTKKDEGELKNRIHEILQGEGGIAYKLMALYSLVDDAKREFSPLIAKPETVCETCATHPENTVHKKACFWQQLYDAYEKWFGESK